MVRRFTTYQGGRSCLCEYKWLIFPAEKRFKASRYSARSSPALSEAFFSESAEAFLDLDTTTEGRDFKECGVSVAPSGRRYDLADANSE